MTRILSDYYEYCSGCGQRHESYTMFRQLCQSCRLAPPVQPPRYNDWMIWCVAVFLVVALCMTVGCMPEPVPQSHGTYGACPDCTVWELVETGI